MKPRHLPLIAMLSLTIVAAAAGCDQNGGASEAPPTEQSSVAPPPPSSTATEEDAVVVTESDGPFPRWRLIEDWPRDDPEAGFGVANSTHKVIDFYNDDGGLVRLFDHAGTNLLTQTVDPGWSVQETWLDERYIVIELINVDEREVVVDAYELEGDRVAPLDFDAGKSTSLDPSMMYFGGRLVWATGDPDRRMCLGVWDLSSDRSRTLECTDPGVIIDDLALDDETVVYSLLTKWRSFEKRCKRIQVVDLAGNHDEDTERTIAELSNCDAWSGIPIDSGVVWDVTDPNLGEVSVAGGFALIDSIVYELGRFDTDSPVACGGKVFWDDSFDEVTTPVVWDPKAATYQRAMKLPTDLSKTGTAIYCASNRYLTTRIDGISGRNEHLQLLTLDTRDLE